MSVLRCLFTIAVKATSLELTIAVCPKNVGASPLPEALGHEMFDFRDALEQLMRDLQGHAVDVGWTILGNTSYLEGNHGEEAFD